MATKRKSPDQGALLDQEPAPASTNAEVTNEVIGNSALHVARVAIKHFGGVADEERVLDFEPGANVIAGRNASGKTTVLDAIRCALRITRAAAAGNTHIGSDQKPEITLTLKGDGREITVRCLGDQSPTVREVEGDEVRDIPRAVEFLRDLVDVAGADPAAFEKAKPDEQAAMLLDALDFPGYDRAKALEVAGLSDFRLPPIPAGLHPLEDLEKVVAAIEDARRATGSERDREAGAAEKLLKDLPAKAPEDVAAHVAVLDKTTAHLAAEIAQEVEAAASAHREAEARIKATFDAHRARLKADHEESAASIRAAAEKRIAELSAEMETTIDGLRTSGERELSEADAARDKALAAIESKKATLAEGREQLAGYRAQQESLATDRRVRSLAQEAKAKAETHDLRWKELDAAIKLLKRHAAELAGQAPIKGLRVGFDEKGKRIVTLDEKPLDKLSGSELTALSARVAALRSRQGGTARPLRLILLDELGRSTLSRRKALLEELASGGAQVIAAIAEETPELAVRGAA